MRLSRQQGRRIGRAQRAAHAFHWFAHHPLCEEYGDDVVRFGGRMRVCKGCFMFAVGMMLGAIAGIGFRISEIGSRTSHIGSRISDIGSSALGLSNVGLSNVGFSALGSSVLGLSALAIFAYSLLTPRRLPKTLTRLLPAFLGTFAVILAPFLLICVPLAILLYRRRGPNRSPCLTCPERAQATPCRGYKPIADAERAFIRLSHRIIDGRAN